MTIRLKSPLPPGGRLILCGLAAILTLPALPDGPT